MIEKLNRIIEWTKIKVRIEKAEDIDLFFYEREIWWTSIGINVGFEQDGKHRKFERPILVLRKFGKNTFWGIPMSSKDKEGPFYQSVVYEGNTYTLLLTQMRIVSSKRLIRKLRTLPENEFKETKARIKELL